MPKYLIELDKVPRCYECIASVDNVCRFDKSIDTTDYVVKTIRPRNCPFGESLEHQLENMLIYDIKKDY
jgi:hypothetical protein